MSNAKSPELPMPWLLKVKEVCHHLRVSRTEVWRLMKAGILAHVRIGRARRVPAYAVVRLIQESGVDLDVDALVALGRATPPTTVKDELQKLREEIAALLKRLSTGVPTP
jgi:excisionase family DNA binding protein